jgi:predicted alpha/beta superfamily hydrolase
LADDDLHLTDFVFADVPFFHKLDSRKSMIMKPHQFLVPALIFLITATLYGQSKGEFSRKQASKIQSEILNESRAISIYLPADYNYSSVRYPVLYLLDGEAHLAHASAAADYLAVRGRVPGIIVVAVHNIDRSRDFSPVHVDNIPTSGGAEKFLGFLSDELAPYLDENYRTAGFNILLGHSFGGTFIGYTLLAKPRLFDAYLAVSPYLMYADNLVVNMAAEKLKPFKQTKYFYMTVGNEEGYFETLDEYASIMKEKAGESVNFKYVKMLEEDHGTTPYFTLFSGLKFIFKGYQLPQEMLQVGLEAIDDHFVKISKRYGIKVKTPELVINALGYQYLQEGDYDQAIAVFQENVMRYPQSANVYDSLGEALENQGNIEKAVKNYEKAVMLGEKNGDANLSVYKTNLERVSQK